MKLTTPVSIDPKPDFFNHGSKIISIGSCFSDHVGALLDEKGFRIDVNPFGILFNPHSIAKNIMNALDGNTNGDSVVERDGKFFHYDYHSEINASSKAGLLETVEQNQKRIAEEISQANRLVLTWGTAWVYKLLEQDTVVANCHKIPQNKFEKALLDLEVQVNTYQNLFNTLRQINPQLEILLTVSPVKHIKNGLHENNLSKSVLLLLCEKLVKSFDFVHYFPAYEIVIDELRDYRFFNVDMIHPTEQTVEYVYNRFAETYFTEETHKIVKLTDKFNKLKKHRFMNATPEEIEAHEKKVRTLSEQIAQLKLKA